MAGVRWSPQRKDLRQKRHTNSSSSHSSSALTMLRQYYAPWQRRLRALDAEHNLTLFAEGVPKRLR